MKTKKGESRNQKETGHSETYRRWRYGQSANKVVLRIKASVNKKIMTRNLDIRACVDVDRPGPRKQRQLDGNAGV